MNRTIFWLQLVILNMGLFLFAACIYPMAARAQAGAAITVGKAAPAFTLTDIDNKNVSLSDLKGKFVVLEWINFECPFVKKHYSTGNMQKLQKEYLGKGVVWLSVNSSAPGKPGNFSAAEIKKTLQEKHATPSHYLIDSDGKVGKLYGAKSTPDMFVINPQGVLIYAGAIDDKPSTDVEDVATAHNYVKAALDNALAGQPVKLAQTKSYGCSVKYAE